MDIRKDLPAKIYHYTSLEALCSIVENQEFWLGDSRQMNDYNEALELLKPLNTLLNQDNDLYVKEDKVNIITKRAKEALTKTPLYIASFTALNDDASQWERYAQNATGVSIEFDLFKLQKFLQFNSQMLRRITYISGNDILSELVQSDMYRQAKNYILSDDGEKDPFFILTVTSYALWFKNKGFCQEDEIRFMLPSFFHTSHFDMEQLGRVEYVKESTVKAYFKLNLKSPQLYKESDCESFWDSIISITVGPRSKQNPDILKGFLSEKLRKNGFDGNHIVIKESACSLR